MAKQSNYNLFKIAKHKTDSKAHTMLKQQQGVAEWHDFAQNGENWWAAPLVVVWCSGGHEALGDGST